MSTVSGWMTYFYLIIMYPYFSCLFAFGSHPPYVLFKFCKLQFIFVCFLNLDLIREIIITVKFLI